MIEPHNTKPAIAGKIVVYMNFENLDDIVRFLLPHKHYQFVIYAKVKEQRQAEHITVKPFSNEFHADVETASGVISNAGFELASECLSLGKKLLVKPLLGQYEQLCNAVALEQLQRGTVMHTLDQNILTQWLTMPGHQPMQYPDTALHLAQWLKRGNWQDTQDLVAGLWGDVAELNAITAQ